MSIFKKNQIRIANEKLEESLEGGDYGIHVPWVSFGFLIAGVISEITDGILMYDVLGRYVKTNEWSPILISAVTAFICFASMAAIGYQSANTKVKYKTKALEIGIWLLIGFTIASLRIFKSLDESGGIFNEAVWSAFAIGILQLLLYLGSGMMTYSASKQLTNRKLFEYLMAQYEYNELTKQLSKTREQISTGIHDLSLYPDYVVRLKSSKTEVFKNVGQYNKATKAMCEAKMSIVTNPDQMDEMYESAKIKEIKENRKWSTEAQI